MTQPINQLRRHQAVAILSTLAEAASLILFLGTLALFAALASGA